MKKYLFSTITFIFLLFSKASFPQSISNPSFEGDPRKNYPPWGWEACDGLSTPDTEPGFWNVTESSSHGKTFLYMVTRGSLGPTPDTWEDCQTQLSSPLLLGECYRMSIDLALGDFYKLKF